MARILDCSDFVCVILKLMLVVSLLEINPFSLDDFSGVRLWGGFEPYFFYYYQEKLELISQLYCFFLKKGFAC